MLLELCQHLLLATVSSLVHLTYWRKLNDPSLCQVSYYKSICFPASVILFAVTSSPLLSPCPCGPCLLHSFTITLVGFQEAVEITCIHRAFTGRRSQGSRPPNIRLWKTVVIGQIRIHSLLARACWPPLTCQDSFQEEHGTADIPLKHWIVCHLRPGCRDSFSLFQMPELAAPSCQSRPAAPSCQSRPADSEPLLYINLIFLRSREIREATLPDTCPSLEMLRWFLSLSCSKPRGQSLCILPALTEVWY